MNWVGGSRNRLVMKNDSKKQREFFEKRKMQQKLKNMGLALPAASPGPNPGSMDLVTLFVVNQIAAKKETRDPPKAALLGSSKGRSKPKRRASLVLPMSPCSPSQLSLAESQPQYSAQGIGQRTNAIPQGFKFHQLSPVLESAFSDNSASDYLPPTADALSSFSSASSASSGQGVFPLQISLQQRSLNEAQPHCSSPAWDPSGLDQTKFQPFSLARGMAHNKPWSVASNQPLCQWETPTAAQILFGNPDPIKTELRHHASQEGRLFFNRPVDKESTSETSEKQQQFKEDVFRGFCHEEYEREGRPKSKIYLRRETQDTPATPQAVPDSESGEELSSSTYTNLSAGCGHKTGPVNSCEHLPSYSFREGYLSSDSNDEEECCQLCLNTPTPSCINQACCDTPRVEEGSQGKPKQRHSQLCPFSPPLKAKGNLREEPVTDEEVCLHTSCIEDSTTQRPSPCPLTQTQSSGLCKCKKLLSETREAGTQTVTVEMCDASIQCDRAANDTEFNLCFPLVDVSVQLPATGRQPNTAAEPNDQQTPSGNWGGGMGMPRSNKSKDYSLTGSSDIKNSTVTAERSCIAPEKS